MESMEISIIAKAKNLLLSSHKELWSISFDIFDVHKYENVENIEDHVNSVFEIFNSIYNNLSECSKLLAFLGLNDAVETSFDFEKTNSKSFKKVLRITQNIKKAMDFVSSICETFKTVKNEVSRLDAKAAADCLQMYSYYIEDLIGEAAIILDGTREDIQQLSNLQNNVL